MISITGADYLHKIVVLNPKGGCGKTTLATNLAASYAQRGRPPTLLDCDPQGYSKRWLEKRPEERPAIYGVDACGESADGIVGTETQIRIPPGSSAVIFDLPAAIPRERLHIYTYIADSIVIPVMPSEIDVFSAARFISELLVDVQLDRREQKLAIVANRVRRNTRSCQALMRFLDRLDIPMVAVLRDSQNFVHATAEGIGICEMPAYRIKEDLEQMSAIQNWLDRWRTRRSDDAIEMEYERIAARM